jgi:hypothetical protein
MCKAQQINEAINKKLEEYKGKAITRRDIDRFIDDIMPIVSPFFEIGEEDINVEITEDGFNLSFPMVVFVGDE